MGDTESTWKPATILPGLLLVAVACSQIYLTQTSELTPSKGGGFGMFAAVDMRSSRMWSIECLTEDETPCRVLIRKDEGPLGTWLGEAFRTKPDASARALAADRIFRARFAPASYAAAVERVRLTETLALLPAGWRDKQLLRLPRAEDAGRREPMKLKALRFQAWRLHYDQATNRVHCEPIGQPEVRGQW